MRSPAKNGGNLGRISGRLGVPQTVTTSWKSSARLGIFKRATSYLSVDPILPRRIDRWDFLFLNLLHSNDRLFKIISLNLSHLR